MATEKTLVLIKPDGVRKNIIGEVLNRFNIHGLKVKEIMTVQLTTGQVQEFYSSHEGRPYFDALTDFMSSGPCIALVVEGVEAISRIRQIIGPTDPVKAPSGTIRGDFAKDAKAIRENVIHASDSQEAAEKEIAFFFKEVARPFIYQDELEKWQFENFGTQSPYRHALGVAEEIGELCHLVLKREQRIRKSANGTEIKADIADAFSDYVIYGIQMMTSLNLDAARVLDDFLFLETYNAYNIKDRVRGCLYLYQEELAKWSEGHKNYNNVERLTLEIFKKGGSLVEYVTDDLLIKSKVAYAFSELVMLGVILMRLEGIDAEKVLAETIEKVMQRDWTKNKVNGEAEKVPQNVSSEVKEKGSEKELKLGDRLRIVRIAKGLMQKTIYADCQIAASTFIHAENNRRHLSNELCYLVSSYLNINLYWLETGHTEPFKDVKGQIELNPIRSRKSESAAIELLSYEKEMPAIFLEADRCLALQKSEDCLILFYLCEPYDLDDIIKRLPVDFYGKLKNKEGLKKAFSDRILCEPV